jgi:hypothetical protein
MSQCPLEPKASLDIFLSRHLYLLMMVEGADGLKAARPASEAEKQFL